MLEAGKDLAGGSQTAAGSVRIAAPADFLDFFQVEWVIQFLSRHPKVRLDFVLSDARADLIEEGIDAAFRSGAISDRRLIFRQLMPQSFKLVASPGYLQARGEPGALRDLSRHDCLIASGRTSPIVWTLRGPGGSEEVRVGGRFSANSARILLKGCLSGLGIALLPNVLIAPHLAAGRLVHVLPEYAREGGDLNVLVPSSRQIPAAVSAFVDFATRKLWSMIEDGAPDSAPDTGLDGRR